MPRRPLLCHCHDGWCNTHAPSDLPSISACGRNNGQTQLNLNSQFPIPQSLNLSILNLSSHYLNFTISSHLIQPNPIPSNLIQSHLTLLCMQFSSSSCLNAKFVPVLTLTDRDHRPQNNKQKTTKSVFFILGGSISFFLKRPTLEKS
jgi:hypothetical protein